MFPRHCSWKYLIEVYGSTHVPILVCEHERIFIAEKSRAQPPAWHATSRINIKRALCYLKEMIPNLQQTQAKRVSPVLP